jgi:hypothetical protein
MCAEAIVIDWDDGECGHVLVAEVVVRERADGGRKRNAARTGTVDLVATESPGMR